MASRGANGRDTARAALETFLRAFEDLDWEAFRASFTDGVTFFFPTTKPHERAEGRQEVEARFREVFEDVRLSARSGPPYQRLVPEDLRIDLLGPSIAVATFHLRDAERLARRTVVLTETDGAWRIVHLHASNVPRSGGTEATRVAPARGREGS